jgi:hypothetical protein
MPELRRLEHDGAAARERRGDFPHPDHEREIPRHDRSHHADGLAQAVRQRIGARRNHLTVDLIGPAGVVRQRVENRRQILPANGGDRFAGVEAFELDERVLVIPDQLGPAKQQPPPFGGLQVTPLPVEGSACRHDGRIDVGGITLGDPGNDGLGGGIDGLEVAARLRRPTCPVNQQLLAACRCLFRRRRRLLLICI